MFVDRTAEIDFLDRIASRSRPGPAQLILLYGRRRVGKTMLLHHWMQQIGLPATFWTAEKEPAPLQRRKLYAALSNLPVDLAPIFSTWSALWDAAAILLQGQRQILILDELPYAAESDPAMLSSLQHAWDRAFQHMETIIILCGSQVRVMEGLMHSQSPLFGRMTGQWYLQPLPFGALRELLPAWSPAEQVAAYAVVGGIPAYLTWLDPAQSLVANIREVILSPGSMFGAEPAFLLYDELREPQPHLAILKAIGAGHHTLDAISNATVLGKSHLSSYLARLQDLKLIERRLPATVPLNKRHLSRQGRYHLSDAYFRFYFRFLAPAHDVLSVQPALVLQQIHAQLRAFVGQTAWEELARQWVRQQGYVGQLPFVPEVVGSHWSRHVQVDVVAISWQQKAILLGECKWGEEKLDRESVRELIEQKAPKVLADLPEKGQGWQLHYAYFARTGFTPAARQTAEQQGALLGGLTQLYHDLATLGEAYEHGS